MNLELLLKNTPFLGTAFLLALLIAFFWLAFYYHSSKKLTTPQTFLLRIFFLGMGIAIVAAFLERGILANFFPKEISFIFCQGKTIRTPDECLFIFIFSSLFIALPEEFLKFIFFRKLILPSAKLNQIIDGIKSGIVLGLGFGTIENMVIFFTYLSGYSSVSPITIANLFLMRLLVPTLAHSIYGGIMGYYLSLAKFHKIFQQRFLWQGFLTSFFLHSLFNFLIFTPLVLLTALLLIFTLLILLKWYSDRENFQLMLKKQSINLNPPLLTEPQEMQALISKNLPKFGLLKHLGICPFCFKKLKIVKGRCSYCGRPISF